MTDAIDIPTQVNLQPVPMEMVSGAEKARNYALTIQVVDQDSYSLAGQEVAAIKRRWNTLEDKRTEFVAPLNKVVKSINDFFRVPLENLKEAEDTIKGRMLTYGREQERIAEAQAKAAAEAAEKQRLELERKAREERAKQEAIEQRAREEEARMLREKEESERLASEARERELEAQRRGDEQAQQRARADREAAEQARRDQEVAERKARAEAEKAGQESIDREQAALAAARAVMSAPPLPVQTPRASGVATKRKWQAEVTDKMRFVKAVAAGEAPLSLLEVDEGSLNRMAQAADGQLNYKGVRCYEKDSLAVRMK